ncbi:MAG: hypothetical protein EBR30_03300 [Cytophagia bacterium]|jgi:hypothetical protein|nr:hypothetical protein [Cytophagia bacterium]
MQILKETTVWNTDYSVANHTYLLDNKNRLIAYARSDTGEIIVSKSGTIVLDKRYRTFKIVNHPGLAKLAKIEKPVGVRLFKVQSNQKVYNVEVSTSGYTCTCTGFNFRGKCKHGQAVVEKLQNSCEKTTA